MKLFFTPMAVSDLGGILAFLGGILAFIAESRPLTAQKVVARLKAKCKLIASQPELGQRRPEFLDDSRSFPVERWVIFYRIEEDAVQIHRILDGSRDIDSLIG